MNDLQESAVIYARYSSHAQRDVSIEQQIAECEAFARQNNLKVIKVYADRALSGTSDKRPQFQKMLKDAERGRWKFVITYKVDRFARNRYDSATYKYRLKKYGVRVLYAKESIPEGPEGILLESVLEGSAEYYSANLSQNIRRGMRYNAQECKVNNGALPLGYCKGPDGKYAIVEAEADVVREIFRKVADGVPFVEIANDLNGRGIRTKKGGLFRKNSFQNLVKNNVYIGIYRYSDIVIEGGVPPIVDKAVFLEVQRKLQTKKNPQGRHRENGEYLLTGKLYCGCCQSAMIGISGTSHTGDKHYYYACQNRRQGGGCQKKTVRRSWLERLVVQTTLDYVLQPSVMEWVADQAVAYAEREYASAHLEELRAQRSETEAALNNVMKAIEAGIITPTTKKRLEALEAEAARLENEIYLEEASVVKVDRDAILYWLEKFKGGNLESQEFRRKVIDTFVARVVLKDDFLWIAFNYSGKFNECGLEIVTDAETAAGPESSYKVVVAPPPGRLAYASLPFPSAYTAARISEDSRLSLFLSPSAKDLNSSKETLNTTFRV